MRKDSSGFRKSSFSARGQRCVSVAHVGERVLVKHSKQRTPVLDFTKAEWDAFVAGVKAGEFDS